MKIIRVSIIILKIAFISENNIMLVLIVLLIMITILIGVPLFGLHHVIIVQPIVIAPLLYCITICHLCYFHK